MGSLQIVFQLYYYPLKYYFIRSTHSYISYSEYRVYGL